MEHAEPVRKRLLDAYNIFLSLSFDEEFLNNGDIASGTRDTISGVTADANIVTKNDTINNNDGNKSDENNDIDGLQRVNNPKRESNNYEQKSEIEEYAAPERFAKAEPGGLPWRKNLVKR